MNTFKWLLVAYMVFFSFSANANVVSGIDGKQISGALGADYSGGPFDPGYYNQIDMGTATVGAGVEMGIGEYAPGQYYNSFDFSGNTLNALFNIGAANLPFNGFVFHLLDPNLKFTSFNLDTTNISAPFGLFFNDSTLAIDLGGTYVGSASFSFTTQPVPVPAAGLLLGSGLLGLIGVARRKAA